MCVENVRLRVCKCLFLEGKEDEVVGVLDIYTHPKQPSFEVERKNSFWSLSFYSFNFILIYFGFVINFNS